MRSLAGQDTKKLGRPKGTFKVPEQKVLKLIEENSIIRDYSERFHESKNCLTMSKRQLSEVGDVPRESLRRRLRGKNCFKCKLRDGLCDYCRQLMTIEVPGIKENFADLAEKLKEVRSSLLLKWEKKASARPEFNGANFDPAGSPHYIQTMCTYLKDHTTDLDAHVVNPFVKRMLAPDGPYDRIYNGQAHLLLRDAQTDFIKKKLVGTNRANDEVVALSDFAEPRTTEYYCVYIYIQYYCVYIYTSVNPSRYPAPSTQNPVPST